MLMAYVSGRVAAGARPQQTTEALEEPSTDNVKD
jgi:hypothetical protein